MLTFHILGLIIQIMQSLRFTPPVWSETDQLTNQTQVNSLNLMCDVSFNFGESLTTAAGRGYKRG